MGRTPNNSIILEKEKSFSSRFESARDSRDKTIAAIERLQAEYTRGLDREKRTLGEATYMRACLSGFALFRGMKRDAQADYEVAVGLRLVRRKGDDILGL